MKRFFGGFADYSASSEVPSEADSMIFPLSTSKQYFPGSSKCRETHDDSHDGYWGVARFDAFLLALHPSPQRGI